MTAVARPARDVVVVSGSDALSYLQNLVSQDLEGLADGDAAHSLLLTPQGKLDVDFWLLRRGDGAWLVCEGGFGEQLVESLHRFKIRVEVEVTLDPSLSVLALRGEGARAAAASSDAVIPVSWSGAGGAEEGVDVVGDAATLDAVASTARDAGAQEWSDDEYEAARIAAGVPRLGLDLDAKTIPQEAFLERDAVSFSKGCFLGQELVCRLDTRGHVNRYLRRLAVAEGATAARGAEIIAGDKAVGTVTSAAGSIALGYVRREVEPPAEVTLRADDSETTATVSALP
jgi:folate-binding protein YgfZ